LSAIAELVTLLISSGLPPESIAHAIDLAQQHHAEQIYVHRNPPDVHPTSTGDRRREWDRDRKRLQRGMRLPESEWFPLVAQILQRDGNVCTYCGTGEKLTADHVVPLTRGGTNDPSNLTACCITCNTKKSNKLVSEWLPAAAVQFHVDVHPNPPDNQKPPLILTSLSSSEETLKKERKKESSGIRARAQFVPIPDDWKPSEHAFEVAEKHGSSVSDTEPIFRDYLKSSGKRYADYDAAFYNFLRNQRKFNNGQSNGKPKSAIIQAADDLCRKIAEFDGPPRDRDEIRSGEGQNTPRLLSYR
jgi:5-methylcytosine-specific restriction endonuclease McrA